MPDPARNGVAERVIRGRTALAVAATALLATGPADAQAGGRYCGTYDVPAGVSNTAAYGAPMSYRVIDSPEGRVLLAQGEVMPGEVDKLRRSLEASGAIEEIWFDSPGGNALEGPKMGRLIRRLGLATRVKAGHSCSSACSYAFLGGVIRIVEPGGYYGIHMFTKAGAYVAEIERLSGVAQRAVKSGANPAEISRLLRGATANVVRVIEQDSAQTAAIRARYLIDMSLSLDFMTDAFGTAAGTGKMCFLNTEGLRHYNVSNVR